MFHYQGIFISTFNPATVFTCLRLVVNGQVQRSEREKVTLHYVLFIISLKKNNQRTSGPINAHLTPGPGIYFNAFIHVYSPRAWADNPLGTNVDVNRKPLSLCPFVNVLVNHTSKR